MWDWDNLQSQQEEEATQEEIIVIKVVAGVV